MQGFCNVCISHAFPNSQETNLIYFSYEQVPVDRVAKFGRPSNNKMFLVSKKVEESKQLQEQERTHAVENEDTLLEIIPPTQV